MDAAPVIARGHNVAVFVPPVREAALPVLESARRPLLVLTPDAARAATLARGSDAFAVAGLERARRKLATTPPAFVFCGAADALTLLERSAMRPAQFAAVALAWPEQLDEEGAAALAAVLAECDKDAQRLILTARSGSSTDELIERYAFTTRSRR